MYCIENEQFNLEGQLISPSITQFSLTIDSCRTISENPDEECEDANTILANLDQFYVNYVVVSQLINHNLGTVNQLRYETNN